MARIQGFGQRGVDAGRIVADDEERIVPMPAKEPPHFLVALAREHRRIRDLVAVEMEHGQHGAVARGIEEADALPRPFEGTGLRLPVADHRHHHQIRVVERGAERVREHVPELAAFMDGTRHRWTHMARYAVRGGELPEEQLHPLAVTGDVWIDLAPSALQPDVRDQGWASVSRSCEEDGVDVPLADQPVHVRVEQRQPRRSAPVPEQARLDVLGAEGFAQQWIGLQVDLTDGQVVRRAPPGIEEVQLVGTEGMRHALLQAPRQESGVADLT